MLSNLTNDEYGVVIDDKPLMTLMTKVKLIMAKDDKAQGLWMWALGHLMSQMTHSMVIC